MKLYQSHSVFPCTNIKITAKYYVDKLDFKSVEYLDCDEPHICLYRDTTEIILTQSKKGKTVPNRELYGYGYDAYFITDQQRELEQEFVRKHVNIVKSTSLTDYQNTEFVIEDVDGRWLAFGIKK